MSVKITILGLGRIGASIGLKLATHKDKISVTGYDRSAETGKAAKRLGAVGSLAGSAAEAVREADLVILALPIDEVRGALEAIAPALAEKVLVVDTAPAKASVMGWAKELLPAGRHYVGLFPALNPQVLEDASLGVGSARADLFTRSVVAVASPEGGDEGALRLAADLVVVLGGTPFFTDVDELDGLAALLHTLPHLLAESLMQLTLAQPSWDDLRKLGGPAFHAGTALLAVQEPAALAEAVVDNRTNMVRVLDDLIGLLSGMREEIQEGRKGRLLKRFEGVHNDRQKWLQERFQGDWLAIESGRGALPGSGDFARQQFLGSLGKLFGRGDKTGRG